jgi:hypothetical protein
MKSNHPPGPPMTLGNNMRELVVRGLRENESDNEAVSQAGNGERRTTQVLQLDTAEQTAEQYYFELLSQLGETRGRPTGHEFLADPLGYGTRQAQADNGEQLRSFN